MITRQSNFLRQGFSNQFTFDYDWHWRGEHKFRFRCRWSATKWNLGVKWLHDFYLSPDLLGILNPRFLLVGGYCTKDHYRKILPTKR
ncbi:hypothetical protein F5B18DRAFT_539303 [Nemania serpens]|nr:hypothetical protein F5B18DRAFT_539303 [Nemania serpens]